jgi:hypothetical protein
MAAVDALWLLVSHGCVPRMKTRIFISCGQRKYTDEAELALKIAEQLKDDFDPYVAVVEQSVRGLRENIFNQLRTSEYFLFIDFKREEVLGSGQSISPNGIKGQERIYRGSLFTHQELAIASYLDLETLAFHEKGIAEADGMRGIMQLNSELFSNRQDLPDKVVARVREKWTAGWKNELTVEASRETGGYSQSGQGPNLYHYHLKIHNNHRSKIARDCCVFVEKWENMQTNEIKNYETVPLKWGGALTPTATILQGTTRRFDSFQIPEIDPSRIIFRGFSDSGEFRPEIIQPGTHRITYAIVSSNFETVRKTVEITTARTAPDAIVRLL